jgi:hypothetical protein
VREVKEVGEVGRGAVVAIEWQGEVAKVAGRQWQKERSGKSDKAAAQRWQEWQSGKERKISV